MRISAAQTGDTAAQQQDPFRPGMLQEGVVNLLLRGLGIGITKKPQAIGGKTDLFGFPGGSPDAVGGFRDCQDGALGPLPAAAGLGQPGTTGQDASRHYHESEEEHPRSPRAAHENPNHGTKTANPNPRASHRLSNRPNSSTCSRTPPKHIPRASRP